MKVKNRYLKIGKQKYIFQRYISEQKYEELKNHPQFHTFYFVKTAHKSYKFYLRNNTGH